MILKNPRHEHFAQLMAQGMTQTEAAVTAGYSEARARAQGSLLAKDPDVAKRIKELSERTAERTVAVTAISKAWVIERLRENTERSMQAVPVVKDGKQTGEYTWNPSAANRSLELIGKELGMFVERQRITIDDIRKLSTEELLAMMENVDGRLEGASESEEGSVN